MNFCSAKEFKHGKVPFSVGADQIEDLFNPNILSVLLKAGKLLNWTYKLPNHPFQALHRGSHDNP